MQSCLHHHSGIGEQINTFGSHLSLAAISTLWIVTRKFDSKLLHDSIDALTLTRESKALEDNLQCVNICDILQIILVNKPVEAVFGQFLVCA